VAGIDQGFSDFETPEYDENPGCDVPGKFAQDSAEVLPNDEPNHGHDRLEEGEGQPGANPLTACEPRDAETDRNGECVEPKGSEKRDYGPTHPGSSHRVSWVQLQCCRLETFESMWVRVDETTRRDTWSIGLSTESAIEEKGHPRWIG
jgi:hypothetical protein